MILQTEQSHCPEVVIKIFMNFSLYPLCWYCTATAVPYFFCSMTLNRINTGHKHLLSEWEVLQLSWVLQNNLYLWEHFAFSLKKSAEKFTLKNIKTPIDCHLEGEGEWSDSFSCPKLLLALPLGCAVFLLFNTLLLPMHRKNTSHTHTHTHISQSVFRQGSCSSSG